MIGKWWGPYALIALAAFVGLGGCAEPVKDIDRTQGNLIRKADLDGEWYVLDTIVDVPSTTGFTFIGETGRLERIHWVVQKDVLVAYRSYPLVPGADAPSTGQPYDQNDNPVAAWPIIEHVDVRRDYNSETGEESNVIAENTEDRLWWQREYIRVDWSKSLVTNFDFIAPTSSQTSVSYFVEEEQGGKDAFYREKDDEGRTNYFDVTGKMFVEPDEDACWLNQLGLGAYDCTSAEILVRTSFSRVPAHPTYEPYRYDDQMLGRFGYFRSERYGFDEQRGVVDAARQYMINRHDIWKADLDADGKPIPIPKRETKTVPYYLSEQFPKDPDDSSKNDPALLEVARHTMAQWDEAAKRGVEAAQGKKLSDSTHVYVLCQNPVQSDDPKECGEVGFSPRIGDLRYSQLYWVDTNTVEGLLGYGPSAADPVTGEIISGKAYIYGAAVNNWAAEAVDMIRYFNGDLDAQQLAYGAQFQDEVRENLAAISSKHLEPDARLARMPIGHPMQRAGRPAHPTVHRENLRPFDRNRIEQRMEAARQAGKTPMLMNDEVKHALSSIAGKPWDSLSAEERDKLDPSRVFDPVAVKRVQDLRARARARNADLTDMVEPSIDGIVRQYQGRTDYDQMWREIRAKIFASTSEHEVGHTMGLRHNFAGSYDSINYPDGYWKLRQENLIQPQSVLDLYHLEDYTEAQRDGAMRQKQYSSIMDYGYSWFNDIQGIGKYDQAAIIFGYTAGTYEASGERCQKYPSVDASGGKCLAKLPGYVEVFDKDKKDLGDAGDILTATESGYTYDDSALPSINILERVHYTQVAQSFPALEDMTAGRKLVPYADYLDSKAANGDDRMVRVPYLFCSDEWTEAVLSCNLFDQGADPFEETKSRIDDYRAYYWFTNFRRDRVDWDVYYPMFGYLDRIFMPLSNYFQNWYLAPYNNDALHQEYNTVWDMAINAGFNLFSEVLSTPSYGTFCRNKDGQLVNLTEQLLTQNQVQVDDSVCAPGTDKIEIAPGEGRRPFSFYDPSAGYYLEDKPQEAGHFWTTEAAIWALFDPDAYVIGLDGDAGVFAISYYDWFADEIDGLFGGVLSKDYPNFAPRARLEGNAGDGSRKASLYYTPVAPLYGDDGGLYDPETGKPIDTSEWTGGSVGLCEPCETSEDCAGFTGGYGGTYCQSDGDQDVCLQDCSGGRACPGGTHCDANFNCVPDAGKTCASFAGSCDAAHLLGACDAGKTCVAGTCVEPPPVVQAEPTFIMDSDMLWYGMLLTTASYSTAFNDQLNVFRVGNGTQVDGDPAFSERHQFTDPLRGTTYAAVQPRCDGDAALGGSAGICGACEQNKDCAGYTGFVGGVFCQSITDGGAQVCLQDCSEDASLCGTDETCDDNGNCVPKTGTCVAPEPACDEAHPHGACAKGETCIRGACLVPAPPSPRCQYLGARDTAAVRLIDRGAELSDKYQRAFAAYYGYNGPDQAENDRLARDYFSAQYELQNHLDLLETVVATYELFGRVY